MNRWVNRLAVVFGAGAALMTGLIGAWHTLPVLTLGLRCLVAGVLIYAFVRAGGELAGRILLEGLAEHELNAEKREREKRERREPRADDPSDEPMSDAGAGRRQAA